MKLHEGNVWFLSVFSLKSGRRLRNKKSTKELGMQKYFVLGYGKQYIVRQKPMMSTQNFVKGIVYFFPNFCSQ